MPCDFCHPDIVDHGFEMNDVRAHYYLTPKNPRCGCDPEEESCEGCGSRQAKIIIEREWFACEDCGHGTDYRCIWVLDHPDGTGRFKDQGKAFQVMNSLNEGWEVDDPMADYRAERYAHPPGMF